MNVNDMATLQELAMEAKRRLSNQVWDYLSGGSESETTLKRNRHALDSIAFRPRVLVDVSKIDMTATLLGMDLRIPVMLAPIGSLHLMHPGAAIPVVKACERFGSVPFISTVTSPPVEEVGSLTKSPKIFQLYVRGDADWCDDMVKRAMDSGFTGLAVTVDVANYARRERDLINQFQRREFVKRSNIERVNFEDEFNFQGAITWTFLERCRKAIGTAPLIVKGIATAEDAQLAVDHGVDCVYVSNHGGRQLDHGVGAIDALAEVAEAVKGRVPVIMDGGVTRGSDVVKAIARGASAVAIGKLQGWALAAGGEDGLMRCFEILEREIAICMALLGVTALDQLGPQHLRAAPAMNPSHALNAYPVFMERFGPNYDY